MSGVKVKMTRICQAAFLILAAAVVSSGLVYSAEFAGTVVNVHDGDTLTVLTAKNQQYKIRLAGIDAPELKQPYGSASRKHLAALVAGKDVDVIWDSKDKYQRVLGKVLVNNVDANLRQVVGGMAWHYVKYAASQTQNDRQLYADAEKAARAERSGLWLDPGPTPPWAWRAQLRAGRP